MPLRGDLDLSGVFGGCFVGVLVYFIGDFED